LTGLPHLEKIGGSRYSDIKKINNVILVAAGEAKAIAIKGALRTGCINELVVDESTAKLLIKTRRIDSPCFLLFT